MKIIDTHSHIYSEEFDEDIESVIKRAQEAGVQQILLPNVDEKTIFPLHTLAKRYPGYCLPMMGLHPTSVTANWQSQLNKIKTLFGENTYIAVGEIGLDFYWDTTFRAEQIEAFEEQLRWSIEYNLPVSIHSRNATEEVFNSIKNVGSNRLRGIFHSFGGDANDQRTISQLGDFMIGINGVITFKNASLSTIIREIDLSRIVIETDAPYLTPVPYRGKRNEPAYTTYIAEKLAEVFGATPQEVGEITTRNAKQMFNI